MLHGARATVRTTRIKICCCRRACGWLPENHLAYLVSDVIDQLDLPAMDEVYGREKRGQPPYDPRMMDEVAGLRLLRGCVQFPADHSPARRCIARVWDRSRRILFRIRRFRLRQQIFDLRT
jgi:hypothetical protein